MKALVVGYFSTVGDIEVLWQVERRLEDLGIDYDVSSYHRNINSHIPGAVDWSTIDPVDYTHLLVVCGPFFQPLIASTGFDLGRFAHCVRVGVNLSVVESEQAAFPLDALVGRDWAEGTMPDLSFLEQPARVPVAGLCLLDTSQSEYRGRQNLAAADAALTSFAKSAHLAVIPLDTLWPAGSNAIGIASPEEYESICARLDVVMTTRLHGLVLALKNGVPAIAVDSVSGGAKVRRQAEVIAWPMVFSVEEATPDRLASALTWCLSAEGKKAAKDAAARGRDLLEPFPKLFSEALAAKPGGRKTFTKPEARLGPKALTLTRLSGALSKVKRAVHRWTAP